MQGRFLLYGDSNTMGYVPGGGRLAQENCFGAIAASLVPGLTLIADGLSGRASAFTHSLFPPELLGGATLVQSLNKALPLDGFLLMLGTNDIMPPLNKQASEIATEQAQLLTLVRQHCGQEIQLVVISPPPLAPNAIEELVQEMNAQVPLLAQDLAPSLAAMATTMHAAFFDAQTIIPHMDAADGYHLTARAHHSLGLALGEFLAKL